MFIEKLNLLIKELNFFQHTSFIQALVTQFKTVDNLSFLYSFQLVLKYSISLITHERDWNK